MSQCLERGLHSLPACFRSSWKADDTSDAKVLECATRVANTCNGRNAICLFSQAAHLVRRAKCDAEVSPPRERTGRGWISGCASSLVPAGASRCQLVNTYVLNACARRLGSRAGPEHAVCGDDAWRRPLENSRTKYA